MINKNKTRIGSIHEVNGSAFVACLISEAEGFKAEITLDGAIVRVAQVGSYLTIKQSGPDILVIVESMWFDQNNQGDQVMMLRVNPLGEFTSKAGFQRGVTHFPTLGAELHLISGSRLERIFSRHGTVDFNIGRLSSFEGVNVALDATAFFGRHAAILGQSGSGKSWMVASLIQSALKSMPNSHIILLDPHNEYSSNNSFTNTPVFPAEKTRCVSANELEIPYWLLSYEELIELLIDKEEEYASLQIAFLRGVVLDLKRESNDSLQFGQITVDSPVYFSLEELYNTFKKYNDRTADFGKGRTALTGKFDSLLIKLESRLNDTRYDFLLRPKVRNSTNTLNDLTKEFLGLAEPTSAVTIIDLSTVPHDVLPTVTAQIGRLAFEFNFWNPRCREFPLLLVCDEAHTYIAREENTSGHKSARRSFERIAKTGRKYGVGLCIVSQRPNDLSETVLSQCSSYFCMRITNPIDQEYIRSLVPDAAHGILDALTSLSQGEAIATGEAVPMPLRLKVNVPNPPPNSQNVDYAGMWSKKNPHVVEVDEIVKRWQLQER
ncbi:MAG: DUF853 family protein [Xanthomonadales bacterium]|nr:DUF853 family protein [Xanthomonadales bacterium]